METQLRAWQLRTGRFSADEPEYDRLPQLIGPGDWVLDVGANIGHYTLELARLVGPTGRVIALEPTPLAFAQLAGLVSRSALGNVTLINAAASDTNAIHGMSVPRSRNGLPSYYQARLDGGADGLQVLTLRIDDLPIPRPVALVKIDVEGHEIAVLQGMRELIESSRPILVVEDSSPALVDLLQPLGYRHEKLPGSPNVLFRPSD